ncbi:MAG: GNAT family protein [Elusimicrobiaceae bacterium]|jgi:RimJ/RimL family protein N-acetyltransferase
MNGIVLKSERLLLKTVQLADAEAIFAYRSLPEIRKYQGNGLASMQAIISLIKSTNAIKPDTPGTWYQLGIIQKQSGIVLGDMGIHFIENRQAELGYTLAPQYQGYGYASEAVVCVMDYLFGKLGKHRIITSTDPKNKKSIRLLERIGLRQEACFKKSFWTGKSWADDAVYAVLRTEWPRIKKNMISTAPKTPLGSAKSGA